MASSSLKWVSNTWVVSWENYKCFIVSNMIFVTFVAVQLLSHVRLFVTSWTAAHQASLSFTTSWSLLRFMSIEWVMLFNHLILCFSLLLLLSVFTSINVFSNELAFHIKGPNYWSFSLSISPIFVMWHLVKKKSYLLFYNFYWNIVALQYCVIFFCTVDWISYTYS